MSPLETSSSSSSSSLKSSTLITDLDRSQISKNHPIKAVALCKLLSMRLKSASEYTLKHGTDFLLAAGKGQMDHVAKYIKNKGNLSVKDKEGKIAKQLEFPFFTGLTALHLAVLKGHDPVVRAILTCRPKVIDLVDSDSNTPLYYAITYNRISQIPLFVQFGANLTHVNKNEESIMSSAVIQGDTEIVKSLLKRTLEVRGALKEHLLSDLINQIVAYVGDSEICCDKRASNYTPFFYAIFNRRYAVISLFIEFGFNPLETCTTAFGDTKVTLLEYARQRKIPDYLLERMKKLAICYC